MSDAEDDLEDDVPTGAMERSGPRSIRKGLELDGDIKLAGVARIHFRSVGLWSGVICSVGGLGWLLVRSHPPLDQSYLALSLLLAFIAGCALTALAADGRSRDALALANHYRKECERISAAKALVEAQLLKSRLSSAAGGKTGRRR